MALLVAIALIDRSLVKEIDGNIEVDAPAYYFLDIEETDLDVFRDAGEGNRSPTPSSPTRRCCAAGSSALNGVAGREGEGAPEAHWVLNGDRGLTYADDSAARARRSSRATGGRRTTAGEPLVSFEAEIAKGLGLKIGDTSPSTCSAATSTARIANLREVKWEMLAINFVMVFSPNTLAGAPHNLLVTTRLPKARPLAARRKRRAALGRAFPAVTAIRVKDALEAVNASCSPR